MGGYRGGGGSSVDAADVSANTSARHNRSHAVDSTTDHTVGSVAAGGFMVNRAGTWSSSIGETAKAGIVNGTTYLLGGANEFIYGNINYAGLTGGGLMLSNVDAPHKMISSSRANAVDNKAVVLGAGVSGTSPVLDPVTIGWYDTAGPTWYDLYRYKGDGLVQTDNITSEYMPSGGRLHFDGDNDRIVSGFQALSDNTVHADWTEVTGDASGTFAKSSGVITVTAPAGTTSEYTNGDYGATRLEMSLPSYMNWEILMHRTCEQTTNAGSHFGVYFTSTADFVNFQHLWNGSAYQELVYRGVSTILYNGTAGTAQDTWQRIANDGGTIILSRYNAAIGSPPTESDWTEIARYAPTWALHDVTVFLGALSLGGGAAPGATPDFGLITIKYL